MAEWPKKMEMPKLTENVRGLSVEVVPADLARELYEALRKVKYHDQRNEHDSIIEVLNASARYEQEVGR